MSSLCIYTKKHLLSVYDVTMTLPEDEGNRKGGGGMTNELLCNKPAYNVPNGEITLQ